MSRQVNVYLRALNGNIIPPQRILNLTPSRNTVAIGRASKSLTKGFSGAVDNGWCNSPVMSRDHARIIFHPTIEGIAIEDIGSMHGTFVNGIQLPLNEQQILHNDDVLVFGSEVRRGSDKYPACSFQVNYQLLPYRESNTYKFPESSDMDEGYDFSEDENLDCICEVSNEETPHPNTAQMAVTKPTAGAIIDLVRGPSSKIALQMSSNSASPVTPRNLDTLFAKTNDTEEDYLSVSEDEFDAAAPERSPTQGQNPDDVMELLSPKPDNHSETSSEGARELDNESNFSLEEAGAAGVRALVEDGLLSEPYLGPCVISPSALFKQGNCTVARDQLYNTSNTLPLESSCNIDPAPSRCVDQYYPPILCQADMVDKRRTPDLTLAASEPPFVNQSPIARQPSPSDAAMVKTTVGPMSQELPPSRMQNAPPVLNSSQNCSSAEIPARATVEQNRKHAFFATRNSNQANSHDFSERKQPTWRDIQIECPTESQVPERWCVYTERDPSVLENTTSMTSLKYHQVLPTSAPLCTIPVNQNFRSSRLQPDGTCTLALAREQFEEVEEQTRMESPELDMTSAVKYNESKIAAARKPTPIVSTRPGLSINDILDGSSCAVEKSLKRKAIELSDDIEMGVRQWASSSLSTPEGAKFARMPAPEKSGAQPPTRIYPAVAGAQENHANKRLKRFAEAVGYVALGGAAVGAGMFSLLVATAPDFL